MDEQAPPKRLRLDGRLMRSAQTRRAIIDAYLELLLESPKIPTATEIAKRAGVSTRSVFERFEDMLTLSFAAADHVFALRVAQAAAVNADGDRQTRLRSQVETRAEICERWLPLWRALTRHQSASPQLNARISRVYDLITERLKLMYRPELSTLAEPQSARVLITLEALTDFESWGRMRERHGLSVEAACEVWTEAIDRLLPPTPAA
jgi:AcrR family transcriptional regulator